MPVQTADRRRNSVLDLAPSFSERLVMPTSRVASLATPERHPDWTFAVEFPDGADEPTVRFDFSDEDDGFVGPLSAWLGMLEAPDAPLRLHGGERR